MTEPKVLVRNFLEAFSSGDIDNVLDLLGDDATWWVAGSVPGISGTLSKSELGDLLRSVKPLYEEGRLPITPTEMIAEGSRVACEALSNARLWDGRTYANQYHFVFDIHEDCIVKVREYSDTQHMVETFIPASA